MTTRWTLLSFTLIVGYAAIASSALWFAIRRRALPGVLMFRVYLGFVTVSAVAGILLRSFGHAGTYAAAYWINNFLHDLILCLLGIQLIASLVPKRFAVLWSLAFMTLLMLMFASALPGANSSTLWGLASAGEIAAACILVGMAFFPDIEWGWQRGMVAAGMVCEIVGSIIPGWTWAHGGSGVVLAYMTQAAPLGGMVIFLIAAMNGNGKARARAAQS